MTKTGDYLLALRTDAAMSKYRVAQATKVAHGNVFAIEKGKRFPTPDVVRLLAAAYEMSATERDTLLRCIADDLLDPYCAALVREDVSNA